jgi:hypothetical protein
LVKMKSAKKSLPEYFTTVYDLFKKVKLQDWIRICNADLMDLRKRILILV